MVNVKDVQLGTTTRKSFAKINEVMKKAGRPFRIGKGGNGLMWLIGGLGFCGSLLAFVLSFIPPSQISTGNNTVWFAVLFIGVIVFRLVLSGQLM